jgi:hypothetical protein
VPIAAIAIRAIATSSPVQTFDIYERRAHGRSRFINFGSTALVLVAEWSAPSFLIFIARSNVGPDQQPKAAAPPKA